MENYAAGRPVCRCCCKDGDGPLSRSEERTKGEDVGFYLQSETIHYYIGVFFFSSFFAGTEYLCVPTMVVFIRLRVMSLKGLYDSFSFIT